MFLASAIGIKKQRTMSMMKTLGTQMMAASAIHKNSVSMFGFNLSFFSLQTRNRIAYATGIQHPNIASCIQNWSCVQIQIQNMFLGQQKRAAPPTSSDGA